MKNKVGCFIVVLQCYSFSLRQLFKFNDKGVDPARFTFFQLFCHRATQTDFVEIPAIRLKGKWLEQFGFVQGKKIMVETSERKLVITLIDEAKEYAPNIRLKQLGPTG